MPLISDALRLRSFASPPSASADAQPRLRAVCRLRLTGKRRGRDQEHR
jgi:hypothetical protein